ncbi:hypothetical protein N0V90_002100 [Kalmusia sp. IMI 367209]|nr:hypothetical protein N0V90_002100 [Kalmusia sp. IMI 367209]
MDVMSGWNMVNGGRDHSSSLSDLSHTSRAQHDSADGLAMNLDFDVNEFLPMPGIFSSDTQSLDLSPIDLEMELGSQTVSSAQQSDCSSGLSSRNLKHAPSSQRRPILPNEQSNCGQSALTDHQCTAVALRILEMSMASPKPHALPDELLRFLANSRSGTRSLIKLSKCSKCTRYSSFLVLMVINVTTSLDAVDNAIKLLSTNSIRAEASRWTQYGVDTVEEFVRMYSPLLLPIVGALKTTIKEISQVCLTRTLQHQLDSLEQASKRLEVLEADMQELF